MAPAESKLRTLWRWLWQPSARYALATLVLLGIMAGVLATSGFNSFVHYSNSEAFCISCHEMRNTVYQEYLLSSHYANASGVQATCADCHVPRAWLPKMKRKVKATFKEVPSKLLGTIDTPEKFEAHRQRLADSVWASMRANDSLECRNCHSATAMQLASQSAAARQQHQASQKVGGTCIDCHQGIAHKLPGVESNEETATDDYAL
jgi:cytochrome c-type protein NapC